MRWYAERMHAIERRRGVTELLPSEVMGGSSFSRVLLLALSSNKTLFTIIVASNTTGLTTRITCAQTTELESKTSVLVG